MCRRRGRQGALRRRCGSRARPALPPPVSWAALPPAPPPPPCASRSATSARGPSTRGTASCSCATTARYRPTGTALPAVLAAAPCAGPARAGGPRRGSVSPAAPHAGLSQPAPLSRAGAAAGGRHRALPGYARTVRVRGRAGARGERSWSERGAENTGAVGSIPVRAICLRAGVSNPRCPWVRSSSDCSVNLRNSFLTDI